MREVHELKNYKSQKFIIHLTSLIPQTELKNMYGVMIYKVYPVLAEIELFIINSKNNSSSSKYK